MIGHRTSITRFIDVSAPGAHLRRPSALPARPLRPAQGRFGSIIAPLGPFAKIRLIRIGNLQQTRRLRGIERGKVVTDSTHAAPRGHESSATPERHERRLWGPVYALRLSRETPHAICRDFQFDRADQFGGLPLRRLPSRDADRRRAAISAAVGGLAHQRAGCARRGGVRRSRHAGGRPRLDPGDGLRRLRHRLPRRRRDHEGRPQHPRPQHRRDIVVLRSRRRGGRSRVRHRGGDADWRSSSPAIRCCVRSSMRSTASRWTRWPRKLSTRCA